METNKKKVTLEIDMDSWKIFKILAIQMETTLQKVISNVLQDYCSSRNVVVVGSNTQVVSSRKVKVGKSTVPAESSEE
jgi:hypothetical protein